MGRQSRQCTLHGYTEKENAMASRMCFIDLRVLGQQYAQSARNSLMGELLWMIWINALG